MLSEVQKLLMTRPDCGSNLERLHLGIAKNAKIAKGCRKFETPRALWLATRSSFPCRPPIQLDEDVCSLLYLI
jgi:hypothetical protein